MHAKDGIVTGLRYSGKTHQFMAKVNYTRDGKDKEDQIMVTDNWWIIGVSDPIFSKNSSINVCTKNSFSAQQVKKAI